MEERNKRGKKREYERVERGQRRTENIKCSQRNSELFELEKVEELKELKDFIGVTYVEKSTLKKFKSCLKRITDGREEVVFQEYFDSAIEAAEAYDKAAREHHHNTNKNGILRLNFPYEHQSFELHHSINKATIDSHVPSRIKREGWQTFNIYSSSTSAPSVEERKRCFRALDIIVEDSKEVINLFPDPALRNEALVDWHSFKASKASSTINISLYNSLEIMLKDTSSVKGPEYYTLMALATNAGITNEVLNPKV